MKKFLLINVILLQAILLIGQNSLQIFNHGGEEIINGQTLLVDADLDEDEWEAVSSELFVKNNSVDTLHVICRREVISEVANTINNFCYGQCFTPETDESPAVAVAPGVLDEQNIFSGHYQPGDYKGVTTIKYTFFDSNNPDDNTHFVVVFNGSSLELQDHGVVVEYGAYIEVNDIYDDWEAVSPELFVKNKSVDTLEVICRREVITNVDNTTNNFCYGQCFPPDTDESPAVSVAPGFLDETNIFSGHYQPGEEVGTEVIKYTFFDQANEVDATYFTVIFRGGSAAGIVDIDDNASLNAYPNPATSLVNIDYSLNKITNADLVIYNALGVQVMNYTVNQAEGTIHLDMSGFNKGLYFYRFEAANYQTETYKVVLQ